MDNHLEPEEPMSRTNDSWVFPVTFLCILCTICGIGYMIMGHLFSGLLIVLFPLFAIAVAVLVLTLRGRP